jgi:hypothetical protein
MTAAVWWRKRIFFPGRVRCALPGIRFYGKINKKQAKIAEM